MQKSILFIGNSYTYFFDMPEKIFAPMAAAAGHEFEVLSVTHGGYRLSQYADPMDEEGQRLREVVQGRHFDCIVLQDHSLSTILDPDAFFAGIHDLKRLLQDHTDRFVLYATWGRKTGCETLQQIGMTNGQMTEHIARAYAQAGERFGMTVAHVGRAFAAYARKYPDAELYYEDLHHSSRLGSTVAAETILEAIIC